MVQVLLNPHYETLVLDIPDQSESDSLPPPVYTDAYLSNWTHGKHDIAANHCCSVPSLDPQHRYLLALLTAVVVDQDVHFLCRSTC